MPGDPADCLFCRIVTGAATSHVVLEEPDVVGFLDIHPVFKGHVLVVPRAHVVTLPELPAQLIAPLFGAAARVAQAVVDGLGADGSFVACNNTVSQAVPHLHVHVVPRRRKDGLRGFFWPRTRYENAEEMESTAAALRTALLR
jgi:histidine triad (HIT) family protein